MTSDKFAAIASKLTLGISAYPDQPPAGPKRFRRRPRRSRHAATLDLDVLHGHGAKGGAYARLRPAAFGARPPRKVVLHAARRQPELQAGLARQRFLLMVERGLDPLTSGLIFESAYAAHDLSFAASGPTVRRSASFRTACKSTDFTPAEPRPDATDVLFVGELRSIKGVDILLNALAELKAHAPVTATIVGSGPDAATPSKQCLRHSVSTTSSRSLVRCPSARPSRLGRIMVVPSLAESFPYVVLEAAAAGLPLIATNVGGIPEIVADTDTALIEPGNVEALASALEATLDDPEACKSRANRLKANVDEQIHGRGHDRRRSRFLCRSRAQPQRTPSTAIEAYKL